MPHGVPGAIDGTVGSITGGAGGTGAGVGVVMTAGAAEGVTPLPESAPGR